MTEYPLDDDLLVALRSARPDLGSTTVMPTTQKPSICWRGSSLRILTRMERSVHRTRHEFEAMGGLLGPGCGS